MGLLSRLQRKSSPPKADDGALFMFAMMVVSGADDVDDTESGAMIAVINALPEFRGRNADEMVAAVRPIFAASKGSLEALRGLSTPESRRKCFVLAVEIAFASGDISEEEDATLGELKDALNIDDDVATEIVRVIGWKYTS